MATTKSSKKTPAKKKAAPAKTTPKKGSVKARPLTWRFYAVSIGIFIIAVGTVMVIALFTANIIAREASQARYERTRDIFASINVDESHLKDSHHTYKVTYLEGDTVSNTVAELDKNIKAAGFTFVDEPYPGGEAVQYQYESNKGEYIYLTVISKPYDDARQYADVMDREVSNDVKAMDKNAGPAKVTIKVSLDDKNE